jgi:plastocyanin
MRRRARRAALCTATVALAVAVAGPIAAGADGPGAEAAGKRKPVKVKVADDYFSPATLKVKKGTKVKWKWNRNNLNPHNVTLRKGPKGVKKKRFTSATGSIGIKFNRKLKKAGDYKFICTLHESVMRQTITVKRKKKKS